MIVGVKVSILTTTGTAISLQKILKFFVTFSLENTAKFSNILQNNYGNKTSAPRGRKTCMLTHPSTNLQQIILFSTLFQAILIVC